MTEARSYDLTDGEWTAVGEVNLYGDAEVMPNAGSQDRATVASVDTDGNLTSDGVISVREKA